MFIAYLQLTNLSCIFIINNTPFQSSWVLNSQSVLAFCMCGLWIHIFNKFCWEIPRKNVPVHERYRSLFLLVFYDAIQQRFMSIVFLLCLKLWEWFGAREMTSSQVWRPKLESSEPTQRQDIQTGHIVRAPGTPSLHPVDGRERRRLLRISCACLAGVCHRKMTETPHQGGMWRTPYIVLWSQPICFSTCVPLFTYINVHACMYMRVHIHKHDRETDSQDMI